MERRQYHLEVDYDPNDHTDPALVIESRLNGFMRHLIPVEPSEISDRVKEQIKKAEADSTANMLRRLAKNPTHPLSGIITYLDGSKGSAPMDKIAAKTETSYEGLRRLGQLNGWFEVKTDQNGTELFVCPAFLPIENNPNKMKNS